MSRASTRSKKPRFLNLAQQGSAFTVQVFYLYGSTGKEMRIENLGPFDKRRSLKLARWILDTFGEGEQ